MDDQSQAMPLNLCSPGMLLGELKSLNNAFLQTPGHLSYLQDVHRSEDAGDMSFFSRPPGSYNLPIGVGTSMLIPNFRGQEKTSEEEPKPNFSYIGEFH